MVVWFFVGALCKRPWRWKRLNCYVAADAAFFVAVPRFFAGHSPCAPDAGNLFPHPSFRTVEHVFPYSIFCLRATHIWYIDPQDGVNAGFVWNENRPVPIRLHGSLRAVLPKYFISACSKARLFRLRCYVFLAVVGAEMEPATTRKMTKVYLHDNEIAVMVVWFFVGALCKRP